MDKQVRQRGKSKISIEEMDARGIYHENGWVFGVYMDGYILTDVLEVDDDYIVIGQWCAVYEESVGIFTGYSDINGVDIYEGDYVFTGRNLFYKYREPVIKIVYDNGFNIEALDFKKMKVIGSSFKLSSELIENKESI